MRTQLLLRRLRTDRGRTLLALVALLLASATLSAKLHVQRALIEPLHRSLSEQGPNLEIDAPEGSELDRGPALASLQRVVGAGTPVSAERLTSARLKEATIPVRGVDAAALRASEPYLGMQPGHPGPGEALVGGRLAERLRIKAGDVLPLDFGAGRIVSLRVTALLQTGGNEEEQVLVPFADARGTGAAADRVNRLTAVSPAMGAALLRQADALRAALPGARVRVGRESELPAATLLDQWHTLLNWAAGFMVLSAALAVLAAGLALRDRDLADMALVKALGASDGEIVKAGAIEALSLGVVSGILGAALGYLTAGWMAHNLGSGAIAFDPGLALRACGAAVGLAAASALLPMLETLWVRPARLLQR